MNSLLTHKFSLFCKGVLLISRVLGHRRGASSAVFLIMFLGVSVLALRQIAASSELIKGDVEFTVRHSVNPVKGVCGDVFIEQIKLKKEPNLSLAAPFVIVCDVAQMNTGNKARDADLRKALRFPEYKKLTLELVSLEKKQNKYQISGVITIGGVKQNYKSLASISKVSSQINATGRFSLKLSDFDIERPSYLFFKVKDTVEIKYHFIVNVR